jgi:DNA-binding NarL/FixJ family response regulator
MKNMSVALATSVNSGVDSAIQSTIHSLGSLAIGDLAVCHCAAKVERTSVILSMAWAAAAGAPWGPIHFSRAMRVQAVYTTALPPAATKLVITDGAVEGNKIAVETICPATVNHVSLLDPLGSEYLHRLVLNKHKDASKVPDLLLLEVCLPPGDVPLEIVPLIRSLSGTRTAVVLIVSGSDPISLSNAIPSKDMLFVEACEPDPDAIVAFKIRSRSYGSLWLASPDPTMMSLLREPAQPRWRHEPYLAADPTARSLLQMRRAGMSLEQIGQKLDMDKSTVKRRLDRLRFP